MNKRRAQFLDFRWADGVILVFALLLIAALYRYYWGGAAKAGYTAQVSAPGSPLQIVNLDQPRQLSIPGRLGVSVLEITPGRIRFITSPCPHKQCIRAGWLERGGDFAACVPNGVSVQLQTQDERFDALVF